MAKTEEEHILNIQVSYDKAIEGIKAYRGEIEQLKAREKELKDEFNSGKITQDEYTKEFELGKVAQKNYADEIRALQKEVQNNIKTQQAQEGSLKSLRAELSNATKKYDEMSRAERESAKGKDLQEHIKKITAELKGAEEETDRFYRNVGNYKNSIAEALTSNNKFASSLMTLSQEGDGSLAGVFTNAATSVKSFGTALLGLMTNPVFLSIAGIAAAGAAFKWFFDYNKGLAEATRLTQEFTGLAGDELVSVRNGIQAVADEMGHDYKDTLSTVDALMANYGITAQEATKLVADGFASGADLSGDMLSKIQQYAPTFHDAGIGASEMVAILQQTRSGIFSDKGLDIIQTASKKIREMSTGASDALKGIGINSKKIQSDLASGARSTFDVIQEVSTKMKNFGADSAQVGDVLKNIFGKQGADAGIQLIEQLDTMSTSLDEVKKQTGEWGEGVEAQIKATTELKGALSALFDVTDNGFEGMIDSAKLMATKWLVSLVKGCINLANWFINLYNKSMLFRGGVQSVISNFKTLWSVSKLVVNLIIDGFKGIGRGLEAFVTSTKAAFNAVIGVAKGFGKVLSGIAHFSWEEITQGVADMKNSLTTNFKSALSSMKNAVTTQGNEVLTDMKNFGKEVFENYKDGFNEALSGGGLKEISAQAFIESDGENSTTSSPAASGTTKPTQAGGKKGKGKGKGTTDDLKKDEEIQMRKAEEALTQLIKDNTERQRALLEQRYDNQIADLRKMLAEKGKHTAKAEAAIAVQIRALSRQREMELLRFEESAIKQRVETENKKYALLIEAAKAGSRKQLELQLKKLENERQLAAAEIAASITQEQEKNEMLLANEEAFEARKKAIKDKFLQEQRKAEEQAIIDKFASSISDAEQGGDELAALQQKLAQKQALLEAANAAEYESEQAKQNALLKAKADFTNAQKALSDKRRDIEIANSQAIAGATQALQGVMEAFGGKSKALAAASKVLALAQIAISTGTALAKGISQAQSVPFPGNIAAIATTVTTILANIATATKTVKGAKMATGGLIRGRGTGTSDQVPIQASNGESILTAASTSMFSPLLSVFNQLGGGVPIVVHSPAQQQGEEFLAAAVAKGMALAPRPIVSVEDISRVQNRVDVIENLGAI